MRGFVKHGPGPREAEVRRLPDPRPGRGEALIRVAACGVCGSDLHAYLADPGYEWIEIPVVLGHEFSGTVEAVGEGVADLRPGDRVVGVSIQGCGSCPTCARGDAQLCPGRVVIGISYDGGLADLVRVPERHLVRVPDALDLRAAALAEPLSVAVHAVFDRSVIRPGDRVVVSGPGAIGLLCGRLAVLSGADVVMVGAEPDRGTRLVAARRLGMMTATSGEAEQVVGEAFGGEPPDAWIETSGAVGALRSALDGVRRGGTITVVGLFAEAFPFFATEAVRHELSMLFSYGSRPVHYERALELLEQGRVEAADLVSTYPLEETARALEEGLEARVVKPVIVP